MSGYSDGDGRTEIIPAQRQTVAKPEVITDKLMIPMEQVKKAAQMYMAYKPALRWIAPMIGFKIPKELDQFLTEVATGQATGQELTENQVNEFQNTVDTQPRVGEPVMTFKMAKDAWLMHNDGMGTREIAQEFTRLGSPVSHATVARWINEYDEWASSSKVLKIRRIGKYLGIAGLIALWTLIIKFVL